MGGGACWEEGEGQAGPAGSSAGGRAHELMSRTAGVCGGGRGEFRCDGQGFGLHARAAAGRQPVGVSGAGGRGGSVRAWPARTARRPGQAGRRACMHACTRPAFACSARLHDVPRHAPRMEAARARSLTAQMQLCIIMPLTPAPACAPPAVAGFPHPRSVRSREAELGALRSEVHDALGNRNSADDHFKGAVLDEVAGLKAALALEREERIAEDDEVRAWLGGRARACVCLCARVRLCACVCVHACSHVRVEGGAHCRGRRGACVVGRARACVRSCVACLRIGRRRVAERGAVRGRGQGRLLSEASFALQAWRRGRCSGWGERGGVAQVGCSGGWVGRSLHPSSGAEGRRAVSTHPRGQLDGGGGVQE